MKATVIRTAMIGGGLSYDVLVTTDQIPHYDGTCQRRFKYADTNVLATRTLCNWCDTGPRSCADCNAYELTGRMYIKADGRVICSACERALKAQAVEKSQGDLFVEQLPMF